MKNSVKTRDKLNEKCHNYAIKIMTEEQQMRTHDAMMKKIADIFNKLETKDLKLIQKALDRLIIYRLTYHEKMETNNNLEHRNGEDKIQ
ncbi:MAG: hypothetical protein [Microviridae sp.]|nr:MAG: hypothetical protein [Microviridae sp.]